MHKVISHSYRILNSLLDSLALQIWLSVLKVDMTVSSHERIESS